MLTQDEAESLIAIEKRFEEPVPFVYLPEPGENLTFSLVSLDGRESFLLDIRRGRSGELSSDNWRLQIRHDQEVLVRLETGGPPHTNPESAPSRRLARYAGQYVPTPHMQRYMEGQTYPWAFPPPSEFTKLDDIVVTWREFLDYCNLIEIPSVIGDF